MSPAAKAASLLAALALAAPGPAQPPDRDALTLQRAVFLRGDINEGPYTQPQPYTFTVGQ